MYHKSVDAALLVTKLPVLLKQGKKIVGYIVIRLCYFRCIKINLKLIMK